jgi:hypothetical protein
MKKVLAFSFDYVILKRLNQGPSSRQELHRSCQEWFKDIILPGAITAACTESIRNLTANGAIAIKSNESTTTDFITIQAFGVTLVDAAYKAVAKEFHQLEDNGKVE